MFKTDLLNEKGKKFIKKMFKSLSKDLQNEDTGIILEDFDLSLEECNELYGKDKNNLIYYLGMTDITPLEFLKQIRENESYSDWTYSFGNNRLLLYCESIIEASKHDKEECEKYSNIKFFDTSGNRKEKLLKIVEDIEKRI